MYTGYVRSAASEISYKGYLRPIALLCYAAM